MTGGRFSPVKGRERCQRTVSNPPSGKNARIVRASGEDAFAGSDSLTRAGSAIPSARGGRKGRPSCGRKGWGPRGVPIDRPPPIRQHRSSPLAQRRMDAAGALVSCCDAALAIIRRKRPASRAEWWVEVWVGKKTSPKTRRKPQCWADERSALLDRADFLRCGAARFRFGFGCSPTHSRRLSHQVQ